MLVRQAKNAFIRCFGESGYIVNQITRWDRSYNETGTDYLRTLSREAKPIETIVREELLPQYKDVDYQTLHDDYMAFVHDLENADFVITGESSEEIDAKEPDFSYRNGNMRTQRRDYTQETEQEVPLTTYDYNLIRGQKKPILTGIEFELTSRCSERCIHCYIPNAKKDSGGDLPVDKVKSILDEFAEMGGLAATFSGGEAFLYKDLLSVAAYARSKDLQVTILTNAINLRDEQIPVLKELNLSMVQVSLYSLDPEIHDMITKVKGSCEKSKAAIEKMVAADIPVQISCPAMKANYKGFKDVLKYAQSLGIKANTDYIIMAQADFNTANLANRLTPEECEQLFRDIIESNSNYREALKAEKPRSDYLLANKDFFGEQPLCGVGLNTCCVTSNGDVYPCPGWQGFVLGNLHKQTLKEIWADSDILRQLRSLKKKTFPKCLECEAMDYCSVCVGRNYNESNGDMYKISQHDCDVAFTLKRVVEEYRAKGLL